MNHLDHRSSSDLEMEQLFGSSTGINNKLELEVKNSSKFVPSWYWN